MRFAWLHDAEKALLVSGREVSQTSNPPAPPVSVLATNASRPLPVIETLDSSWGDDRLATTCGAGNGSVGCARVAENTSKLLGPFPSKYIVSPSGVMNGSSS